MRYGSWNYHSFDDHLSYILHVVQDEPMYVDNFMKLNDNLKWICVMKKEIKKLYRNDTRDFIPPPKRN